MPPAAYVAQDGPVCHQWEAPWSCEGWMPQCMGNAGRWEWVGEGAPSEKQEDRGWDGVLWRGSQERG
jgi:hypothetical protein